MEKVCGRCSSPVKGSLCPVCGYDCSIKSESVALKAGSVLDDRYVIGRVIGSGGFGITYIAYDTEKERTVAVKEYYPKGIAIRAEDGFTVEPIVSMQKSEFLSGMEKFRNEADILSALSTDTDVIKVFGTFLQNGTVYYVMEYVHGMTIREYTEKYGKINEGQFIYAAGNISSVFGHIHSRNVIHRDISPNNVMVDISGQVRLVDFGNARQFIFDGENSMTVELKPGYAPLEQYQHYGNQGPWTDIYSLGMVLYYALTLAVPDDPMTRLDDDREFQGRLSGIDGRIVPILNRMTAVKVSDRYSCSEELTADIKRAGIKPQKFDIAEGK